MTFPGILTVVTAPGTHCNLRNQSPSPHSLHVLPLKLTSVVSSRVSYENVIHRDIACKLSTADNLLCRQLQTWLVLSACCCSRHGGKETEQVP